VPLRKLRLFAVPCLLFVPARSLMNFGFQNFCSTVLVASNVMTTHEKTWTNCNLYKEIIVAMKQTVHEMTITMSHKLVMGGRKREHRWSFFRPKFFGKHSLKHKHFCLQFHPIAIVIATYKIGTNQRPPTKASECFSRAFTLHAK